jgi:hypothetical protein
MDPPQTSASLLLDKLEVQTKIRESAAWVISGFGKLQNIESLDSKEREQLLKRFSRHLNMFKELRSSKKLINELDFREDIEF